MDVFEFRDKLVNDYRDFTRSFIQPRAEDIGTFLDSEYDGGRYWPSPSDAAFVRSTGPTPDLFSH